MTDRTDLLPYSLDEKLLTELAQGLDDPVAVITRYDYTEDEARALSTNPYVVRQVTALRAELEKSGDMDSLRDIQHGRMLTEHMMIRALRGTMRDEAILKLLEIIDKRKERRDKVAMESGNSGITFALQIVWPEGTAPTPPHVRANAIDGSTTQLNDTSTTTLTEHPIPMYVRTATPDIVDVELED